MVDGWPIGWSVDHPDHPLGPPMVVPNIYYVFFIQILQVAPSLHMVEVRKAKGDTLEFQKVYLACKDHANKWKHTY